MKKIKFLPLFFLISILFSVLTLPAAALEPPEVRSEALLLMETGTGQVFFSRNADERRAPASTTKMMTVLLAIEAVEEGRCSLEDPVTAGENMTFDLISDGSTAGIQVGETMSLENLLYCAMVSSANEACNVIAEYIAGSVTAFVRQMNDRADALGCIDTHFANAHGLPNDDHYTTAWDLYLIADEALSHSLFVEICSTVSYTVPATNLSPERTLYSTNALINDQVSDGAYRYEYASGVKTGFTSAAGYCLVSTASKGGIDLLAVVLGGVTEQQEDGSWDTSSFSDSIALYEWAFSNYSYQTILGTAETVATVPVVMGDAEVVSLRPVDAVAALLPNDVDMSSFQRDVVVYSLRDGEELHAPVSAGEILGEIRVSRGGVTYGTSRLVASGGVSLSKKAYLRSQLDQVIHSALVRRVVRILLIGLGIYLLLVIIYRIQRLRHLVSVRKARRQRRRELAEAEERRRFEASRPPREPEIQFVPPEPAPELEQPEEPALLRSGSTGKVPRTESAPGAPTSPTPDRSAPVQSTPSQNSPAPAEKPVPGSNARDRDYFEEFFRQK